MIYFVCLHTNVGVHIQAQGFTSMLMFFAEADTDNQAGTKAKEYLEQKYKISSTVSSVHLALQQNKKKYCFPESIL